MCISNLSQTVLGIIQLISEIHNPLSLSKMTLSGENNTVWMRTQQISLSCKGEGNSSPLVVFISNQVLVHYITGVWGESWQRTDITIWWFRELMGTLLTEFYNLAEADFNIFCRNDSKRLSRHNFQNRKVASFSPCHKWLHPLTLTGSHAFYSLFWQI